MDASGTEGRRTARAVEEHTPLVKEAMQSFLDRKILERVGFADRGDLVRVAPTAGDATSATPGAAAAPEASTDATPSEPSIVTTDTELAVFDYVRRRLPFLIPRDETIFAKLQHLYPRDYQTRFTICYKQDRNGRLFNFMQMTRGPKYRFEFPDTNTVFNTDTFGDIDGELLASFLKRVEELG
jgi:hypothetical protein